MDLPTGVLGSLTADQEARLQQLWMFLLNAFDSNIYDNNFSTPAISRYSNSIDEPPLSPASFNTTFSSSRLSMSSNNNIIPPSPTTPISPISPTNFSEMNSHKPQHQGSLRKLRRRISLNNASEPMSPAETAAIPRRSSTHKRSLTFQTQSMGGIHLRPSPQNAKVMERVMLSYKIGPDELRQGLLGSLKQDHPDSMLLRFLRARKWDVGKAFVMLVSAIAWRTKKMHIDDDILPRGELYALQQSKSLRLSPREQRAGWDFMKQLRMGKNIIHGVDRAGRPIIDIRVRLHRAEDQTDDVLERYVVHTIESVRMLLRPPLVETAVGSLSLSFY
jgi:CRAL/TRIO, N-terminal domain/CRAL/TRIO domain